MTTDELLEFKKRYVAMTTAAPALIEQVLADDGPEQLPLLNERDLVPAEGLTLPAPPRRGRPRRRPPPSNTPETA